ncbi:MAG: hypothetical protein HQ579_00385, partial [Candidatus Omnitrophica bacterium]|nr:hypothetical protein [Candidatus Omnitrophota bacterium]
ALTHEARKRMTREELVEFALLRSSIEEVGLNKKSLYQMRAAELYNKYAKRLRLGYDAGTLVKLNALKEENTAKCLVWTTDLDREGFSFATDIKQRRRIMGVTKDTDTIRDILVVTSPDIKTEQQINAYLKSTGLDEVIGRENVIVRLKYDERYKDKIFVRGIYEEIASKGSFRGMSISEKDVIIASDQGEFKHDEEFMLIEVLGYHTAANAGLYKQAIKLLLQGEQALIEGVLEKYNAKGAKNRYYYLPPVKMPQDFIREFNKYRLYIQQALTKA